MPVIDPNQRTEQISVPIPQPAPMAKPKSAPAPPPQPVPQGAPPSFQPTPGGMQQAQAAPPDEANPTGYSPYLMVPPPTPSAFVLPWYPTDRRRLPRRRMRRAGEPRKYMETGDALFKAIQANPHDSTPRAVYADWLEENAPHLATPTVLERLRTNAPMWVGMSKRGKVLAIPRVTKQLLLGMAASNPWGQLHGTEFYHVISRNRKGQAHRVRASGRIATMATRPEYFRMPWKHGLYQNGYMDPGNAHEWLTEDPTQEPI